MPQTAARFFLEFLRHPTKTGAIAPSSPQLADRMLQWLDLEDARVVLEYGPGDGAVTPAVLSRLKAHSRFLAIEWNPTMYALFRERLPGVPVVNDTVENVRDICDQHGLDEVDCIVSGLPWSTFPIDLQRRLLDAMMTVLKPGGQFVTFAYLHGLNLKAGREFWNVLPNYFSEVCRSRPVWRNVPPALVYKCRR